MRFILFFLVALTVLSGCQSNATPEETSEHTKTNTEESSTQENSRSNSSESETNEEGTRASTEEDKRAENNSEVESSNNQSDNKSNEENATAFDLNSKAVQEILFNPDGVKKENLTFSQDVITKGMSQSEVEVRYGKHDLVYPGHGSPVIIYGNLGVNYLDPSPFLNNDRQTKEQTNPKNNSVTNVMFYAGLPYEEVIEVLGAPDIDVYETEGGPISGQQLMKYKIEDQGDSTIIGTFWLHDNDSGEKIVDVMTMDSVPNDAKQGTASDSQEQNLNELEKRLKTFIKGYIDELMAYYNDKTENLMAYTRETSPNFKKISANKDSRNYRNHETYEININNVVQTDGNVYKVTTGRKYSHATSNGKRLTKVEYTIVETPQGFMVFDYEETDNEPVE